jgi:hypothetical protein
MMFDVFKHYSCNCSTFIKWALCHHVVVYIIVKGTDVYSVKYRQPDNFVPKLKKDAKSKRGRYSKASRALTKDSF